VLSALLALFTEVTHLQFAGRKWWLLIPAVVAILASLGLGCAVVAYGFMMPRARVFSDLKLLLEWYEKVSSTSPHDAIRAQGRPFADRASGKSMGDPLIQHGCPRLHF
jgi:hypothetical protein